MKIFLFALTVLSFSPQALAYGSSRKTTTDAGPLVGPLLASADSAAPRTRVFVGDIPAEKKDDIRIRRYDLAALRDRLGGIARSPNESAGNDTANHSVGQTTDEMEILVGMSKLAQYENTWGRGYAQLDRALSEVNASNPLLRDVLLPLGEENKYAQNPGNILRLSISSNLGRPPRPGRSGECPDRPGSYGDLATTINADGTQTRGCSGRISKSKGAFRNTVRLEGLRMADQLVNYKNAAGASLTHYTEDDALAPRKEATMLRRKEFVLPVCRKLRSVGLKMHFVAYCGKKAGNENKYRDAGLIDGTDDPGLQTMRNNFDGLLLSRYFNRDTSADPLSKDELHEIDECVDTIVLYHQGSRVEVGQDFINPWNVAAAQEMSGCVSQLRQALPGKKVRVGIYSYSSDPQRKFGSAEWINNIELAGRVPADGDVFFGSPWTDALGAWPAVDSDDQINGQNGASSAEAVADRTKRAEVYRYLQSKR